MSPYAPLKSWKVGAQCKWSEIFHSRFGFPLRRFRCKHLEINVLMLTFGTPFPFYFKIIPSFYTTEIAVELWRRIHSAKRTNILILIVNISIQNIHDHRINFQFHHLKNFIFCSCWYQRSIFFCGTAAANVLKMVFPLQRELSQQRLTFNKRHIPTMSFSQE